MARNKRDPSTAGWIMLAPFLLLFIVFSLIPVVLGFQESFRGTFKVPEGGIGNYIGAFQDYRFTNALKNTGLYILIAVPLMTVVVLVLALLLDGYRSKYHQYIRLAYLLPGTYVGAAGILAWYIITEPLIGPFRDVLNFFGVESQSEIFKPSNLALIFALMVVVSGAGGWIVVQYGGLQEISDDVLEAAVIDGCNNRQLATKIKLPLINKNVVYMVILVIAGCVQLFAEPFLLKTFTGGGVDWSINQVSYTLAFSEGDFSQASAISIFLLLVSLTAALVLIFKTKFFDTGLGR